MTRTGWAAASMVAAMALELGAQDEGKQRVEGPVKRAVAPAPADVAKTVAVEQPVLRSAQSPPPEKFDLSKTGIEWHRGLDAVLQKGKPILLLQILGNYDDVYC